MATTDYDFRQTRNEIIQRAFRLIGALTLGDPLTAEKIDQGITALNQIVKSWQADRIFLWTLKELTQALTATNASYSLNGTDSNIIGIDKAFLRISNTDIPLEILSYRQYSDIPTKTDAGNPTCIAINYESSPTLYVYPVPAGSLTMYYLGIIRLKDMDTASGNADFPVRFEQALTYALAKDLADEYGLPLGERGYLRGKADELYTIARKSDRERADNEFVEPAYRTDW